MKFILALFLFFPSPSHLDIAESWEGKFYKRGATAQCSNFVAHVVSESGKPIPKGHSKAVSWLSWGSPVKVPQKGDIVVYAKYNGYNHVGIYDGRGNIIHRPTRSKPVSRISVNYRKIIGIRRYDGNFKTKYGNGRVR